MSTNIIRRQFLDVEMQGSESEGFALQEKLLDLCRGWLNPAIEDVLERWAPADEHWTIDRLYIDAGSLRREGLERGLVDMVTQALEGYLRERAGSGAGLPTSPEGRKPDQSATAAMESRSRKRAPPRSSDSSDPVQCRTQGQFLQQAFRHFLETGLLPWWFHLPDGRTLEDLIREVWQVGDFPDNRPESFARIVAGETGSASTRKRLARQFSPDFLDTLLAGISQESAAAVREILAEFRMHGIASQTLVRFSEQLWETAFALAAAGERPTVETLLAELLEATPSSGDQHEFLFDRIAQLWPGAKRGDRRPEDTAMDNSEARDPARKAAPKPRDHRQDHGETASRLDLEEGTYVASAGMALLHPFLPRFFEALGIAANDKMLQPERALCLLHFLATGRRFAPEYDLLLPKVLCNVPFDAPVESRIELTAAEEDESAALLAAVIRHWEALGDTSVDGLRDSFLMRPGKLSRRGVDDVLQVEARSYDILLDRLPWGIGLIQLPWMERSLWVEWRF